jgi:hypothetical protein
VFERAWAAADRFTLLAVPLAPKIEARFRIPFSSEAFS